MTNTQKIMTAALAGAAAGVLAGILVAPEKGDVTRKRIGDGSRKIADDIRDLTDKGVSAIAGIKEKLFKKNGFVSKPVVENNMV